LGKYLVTGGSGFIGSHLVDSLIALEHEVIILDNLLTGETIHPQAHFINASLHDTRIINDIFSDIDGCYHLAAIPSVIQSNEDWIGTHQINLTGTLAIFNAAAHRQKDKKVPVVYASSSAVYGDNPTLPAIESEKPSPISAYGVDKYACELHARIAGLIHQVPTFGLRFFNVYGPRQTAHSPYSGVISRFIRHMKEHTPLTVYGDGGQSRDFIYVSDVIKHCLLAMNAVNCQAPVVNVCRGEGISLLQLIDTLNQIFGYQAEIQWQTQRAGDIYTSIGCPVLAEKYLKIRATTPLDQGIESMLNF
jgi:UDP-glucose 4-epimerase